MVDCFPDLSFFVLSTENPSMMKNTQNLNSKYFNHRADKHSVCVFFNIMHFIILAVLFDHHIFRHAVCNMRTNCDTAVGSVRKCVQKCSTDQSTKFFCWLRFRRSAYWQVDVFWFCPEYFAPDTLHESDSFRINLCWCSIPASNKPFHWLTVPVTYG